MADENLKNQLWDVGNKCLNSEENGDMHAKRRP